MDKYYSLKTNLIKNEKLSYFMGKWKFINYDDVNKEKYKYIYDYYISYFGSPSKYNPINSNEIYYFEFKIINDYILVVFHKLFYDILKPNLKDSWLSYNIYNTHYNNSKELIKISDIEKKANNLSIPKIIHWIWFRKIDYKLKNEIIHRAKTWIELNIDFSFYLWTNIENKTDFEEFISELSEDNKKVFEKITIKYNSEITKLIITFQKKYIKNDNNFNILIELFSTNNKNDIIYKTDYLRYMILYEYGGVYTDFNDCICLTPIKYLLTFVENKLIFGQDSTNNYNKHDYNNYFISTKKNNNDLLEYMKGSVSFFPQILKFINDKNLIKHIIDNFIEILELINTSKINFNIYEKKYFDYILGLTYFTIEIKDAIVSKIINGHIFKKIFLKYLHYINNYTNNIESLIDLIKANKSLKHNIDINFVKQLLYDKYNNNIDELIFLNMQIYLDIIISITNLPFFLNKYKQTKINTIDNCYLFKYMSYISFIGHLYDSTCLGTNKIISTFDIELDKLIK